MNWRDGGTDKSVRLTAWKIAGDPGVDGLLATISATHEPDPLLRCGDEFPLTSIDAFPEPSMATGGGVCEHDFHEEANATCGWNEVRRPRAPRIARVGARVHADQFLLGRVPPFGLWHDAFGRSLSLLFLVLSSTTRAAPPSTAPFPTCVCTRTANSARSPQVTWRSAATWLRLQNDRLAS